MLGLSIEAQEAFLDSHYTNPTSLLLSSLTAESGAEDGSLVPLPCASQGWK